MGLNFPTALSFAALAVPIIIFYLLRLRRQPALVSSLLLWQKVLQDQQANAPWQKLRRHILLLLQLILLALLVLALAHPYLEIEAQIEGNVIILLDASASMQATDIAPTRFEAAKAEAQRIIRSLQPNDQVSLILVADTPRPLLMGEARANLVNITAALEQAQPSFNAANWETALALAGATQQEQTIILILSDGAMSPAERANLPEMPIPTQWRIIGQSSHNQAIVALSARESRTGAELFTRVVNYADEAVERLLQLRVDGQLLDAQRLRLDPYPEGQVTLTFADLPEKAGRIQVRFQEADDLLLDNQATLLRQTTKGQVLLVGPGNLFLERVFSLISGLAVWQTQAQIALSEEPFSLTIFDRTLPDPEDPVPPGNLLFIAPPKTHDFFTVKGVFTQPTAFKLAENHPLLAYLNFANVNILEAQDLEPPPWATVLIDSQQGPLVLVGEVEGRRIGLITFDLLKSDLPLQIDYPILMTNLTRWLLNQPPSSEQGPQSDATNHQEMTTNLLNPQESNIRPQQSPLTTAAKVADAAPTQGQWSFWWLVAVFALPVLFWEWYIYWRGT